MAKTRHDERKGGDTTKVILLKRNLTGFTKV